MLMFLAFGLGWCSVMALDEGDLCLSCEVRLRVCCAGDDPSAMPSRSRCRQGVVARPSSYFGRLAWFRVAVIWPR